jgi:hypothetical protein
MTTISTSTSSTLLLYTHSLLVSLLYFYHSYCISPLHDHTLNPDDPTDPLSPTSPLRAICARRGEAASRLNCEASTKQSIAGLFFEFSITTCFSFSNSTLFDLLNSILKMSRVLEGKLAIVTGGSRGTSFPPSFSPPQTPSSSANP